MLKGFFSIVFINSTIHMMTNGEKKLQLYSCFISHPSFSVRIALNLKGLDYECKSINVFKGEQSHPEFLKISPMGFVPALLDGDMVLAESSAIILYLDDKYPQHPLLPHDLKKRAINYQAANIISSTIQPTLRIPILAYIRDNVGPDERITWVHKHLGKGFTDEIRRALCKHNKDNPSLTQKQLQEWVHSKYGLQVSQATISMKVLQWSPLRETKLLKRQSH
ncbi:glutathione S-transferase zeta class isoform X1 [Helianthus annuus]|uniref:glutathione S-transferase zeta class isoform X1 n=1 Tax=Helianthus annuus TaxID=4232 RepID=UPI0016532393|nr:glutathione S-transferase zeta class isoform X1 [Helianthus annuus]